VLAGHDRETLQVQLALQIQKIMMTDASVRDPLRIANRAIGRVREEMRKPQRPLEVRLAS
jgi:hypothetical protein